MPAAPPHDNGGADVTLSDPMIAHTTSTPARAALHTHGRGRPHASQKQCARMS
jgi:hypothetical protein